LLVIFLLLLYRRACYRELRQRVFAVLAEWEAKISHASRRYVEFYGDREGLAGMQSATGKTAALYDTVTREVDAIYVDVSAMRAHIAECRQLAEKGSYLNFQPLQEASVRILSSFTFDTGQLNETDLFGKETRTVTVTPIAFAESLQRRFEATIGEWNRLKEAVRGRYREAEKEFPQSDLDTLLELAQRHNIPLRWLADHPLIGDDEADRTLYESVESVRWADPLAFAERLEDLQQKGATVRQRVERLAAAVQRAAQERLNAPPQVEGTIVEPEDDPVVTFESARRAEERLAGLLAGSEDIDEVEAQAEQVCSRYRKAAGQAAAAAEAVQTAGDAIAKAEDALGTAQQGMASAEQALRSASRIHRNIRSIVTGLSDGQRFLQAGSQALTEARTLLNMRRHLEAERKASQAYDQYQEAIVKFARCLERFHSLEREKQHYETQLADMEKSRQEAARKIARYGRTANLTVFTPPRIEGTADYAVLTQALAAHTTAWDQAVATAKREYDAEVAARAAAEARRRREAEAAAEEARRSSSSSSSWSSSDSSSFGGSWSISGTSSSGGSW
jgi:uncharacterized membrane protein YgcG